MPLTPQKERDLELAARIGQSLLKQNQELTARNEMLDEQLEIAKEEVRTSLYARWTPATKLWHGVHTLCVAADRSAPPRALHERRPAAVLRQHRGDRERRGTFAVSAHRLRHGPVL